MTLKNSEKPQGTQMNPKKIQGTLRNLKKLLHDSKMDTITKQKDRKPI